MFGSKEWINLKIWFSMDNEITKEKKKLWAFTHLCNSNRAVWLFLFPWRMSSAAEDAPCQLHGGCLLSEEDGWSYSRDLTHYQSLIQVAGGL